MNNLGEKRTIDKPAIEKAVRDILIAIGEDPDREGLVGTPDRVARMYEEIFSGLHQDPREHLKVLFQNENHEEMVVVKDIPFYSSCEHHLVPFFGKAHIAYIPNKKVIGVSKLARLLEIYSRRLQIQERIGEQVTTFLMDELKAKGAACVLEAQHFCMTSRGVEKQNANMVTSSLNGVFLKEAETREEFFNMIKL